VFGTERSGFGTVPGTVPVLYCSFLFNYIYEKNKILI
jgi:hypothetical protein